MTAGRSGPSRTLDRLGVQLLALAAACYGPLAVGQPGQLNADTKQYLYLDPADLLRRAPTVWDARIAGGTVTHQNIGYLWPMGPWYWIADRLGIPDWLAQRLWVASILFAAAAGALVLLRHLLPRTPLLAVAAASYGLSPVVLGHVTGQSALLLPFAALPWLVWFLRRALTEGGWRWPAAIALVVTTAGSINGSSVFFVLLGAGLVLPYALWWERSTRLATALAALGRTALLTAGAQLWWMTAYVVGGAVGLPLLATTETVNTTSNTTSAAEVVRGLGYWFFYGADASRPWLDGLAPPYLESPLLIVVTFALPALALLAAGWTRWPGQGLATGLAVTGLVIATIAFPEPTRSPLGRLFESLSRHNDLVLSLRNTQRAAPLLALALALFLGAALSALRARHARAALGAGALVALLVAGSVPALWRTGYVADRFHRDEDLPAYWLDAAEHLDAGAGRILEVPGIDFAAYRWGNTLDPITPGLVDRPFLARELVPMGSRAGVSLLSALDRGLQEGWFEPSSLVPVARLFNATDVVVRSDLEYERYRIARPSRVWDWVQQATGLSPWQVFGAGVPNVADARRPMIDETELGLDPRRAHPPAVAVAAVAGSAPTALAAHATASTTVLAGDGDGIVAAAAAGLLDGSGPLLLSPELTQDLDALAAGLGAGTRIVITDTNRKRTERWYSMRENLGATEPATSGVVDDTGGVAAVPAVPDQRPEARSVAVLRGVGSIRASAYGNPFTLSPEERPAAAFDGDLRTAWRVDTDLLEGPFWIRAQLRAPVDADHVVLHPPVGRPGTRALERVEVVLDGTRRFRAGPVAAGGLRVPLDGKPFERVEVRLLEVGPNAGPAGLAEITIPGVEVTEAVAVPTDVHAVIDRLGTPLADLPLAVVLSRHRADPSEPVRADPEAALRRLVRLPEQADLVVSGTARLSARATDDVLDQLLGLPGAGSGWRRATSSERLPGSIAARASAALDGDPATAWTTPLVGVEGQWWEVELAAPATLRSLTLDVVADAHHSVPRSLRLHVDGGAPVDLVVPPVERGRLGATRTVTVPLPEPVTGRVLRLELGPVDPATTPDWYTGDASLLPVAIAEVQLPGVDTTPAAPTIDTGCRDDLVAVDGAPLPVRARGTVADAVGAAGIELTACGGALTLPPDEHLVTTALGRDVGIDVDRLVARTPAWDRAPTVGTGPQVTITSTGRTSAAATITSDGEPFWVVLDQSHNEGWSLEVPGATVDGPHILQGWASGWLVVPDEAGTLTATASWEPQRTVWIGLGVSAVTIAACVAIVVVGWWRRRRTPTPTPDTVPTLFEPSAGHGGGLATVALWTALGAVVLHPVAGATLGLVGLVALRRPGLQRWLLLVPASLVAAAGGLVLGRQVLRPLPVDATWVSEQPQAHVVASLGVLSLGLLVHLGRPRRPATVGAPAAPAGAP